MTDIAHRIRSTRLEMRLTQEEFAAKLGVTFSTVNRWENGKSKPSKMALKLLQAMFDLLDDRA